MRTISFIMRTPDGTQASHFSLITMEPNYFVENNIALKDIA